MKKIVGLWLIPILCLALCACRNINTGMEIVTPANTETIKQEQDEETQSDIEETKNTETDADKETVPVSSELETHEPSNPPNETNPAITDPPTTLPPATEPPATEPPATEPPATEPPATEPSTTEPFDGGDENIGGETDEELG